MRVMVMIKATRNSEAGVMPDQELITEMGKFNEELVNAGVCWRGTASAPAVTVSACALPATKTMVTDGPFAETKELLAG